MLQHIATTRRRFAADDTGAPGGPQAGPTQNSVAQGQCFADIVGGVTQSMSQNFSGLAGAVVGGLAGGTVGGIIGAATTGMINASNAAFSAAQNSEACQNLDNAALANQLGLGAITAP